jgi:hypothetical protein
MAGPVRHNAFMFIGLIIFLIILAFVAHEGVALGHDRQD